MKIIDFIKEQIEEETLSYEPDVELSKEEANILLDYITNLQEENERLKELCDKYEEEHSTTFNEWVFDKRENKQLKEEIKTLYRYTPEKGFRLVGDDNE